MHVSVSPRVVAAPWEREALEGQRRTFVGYESDVRPEQGPIDLYLSRWPSRVVTWNRQRQLFQITDRDVPGFRELVYQYDAPPDPAAGEPRGPEELAAMIEAGDTTVTRVWRDFDYEFVRRRMREASEYLSMGDERYLARVMEKNRRRQKRDNHARAGNMAARMNEIKRYLPTLAGEEKQHLFTGTSFTH